MTVHAFGGRTLLGAEAGPLYGEAPLEAPLVFHGDLARLVDVVGIAMLRDACTVLDAWDGEPKTARAWSPSTSSTVV